MCETDYLKVVRGPCVLEVTDLTYIDVVVVESVWLVTPESTSRTEIPREVSKRRSRIIFLESEYFINP